MLLPKMNPISAMARGLVCIRARRTEAKTRRVVDCVNPGKVSANKEASVLNGRRHCERSARAARPENQVDSLLSGASRTRDIFPAPGERYAVCEGMTQQYPASCC